MTSSLSSHPLQHFANDRWIPSKQRRDVTIEIIIYFICLSLYTEETQRRVQVLEDMQRRLEEEHALQMSLLLAEQEKAQQRLHVVSI